MFSNRISALQNLLDTNCGALLTSAPNVTYLTGLSHTEGSLLITKEASFYLTDSRYIEVAEKSLKSSRAVLFSDYYKDLLALCNQNNIKKIFVENSKITINQFLNFRLKLEGIEISDENILSFELSKMRECKTQAEIQKIKAAQEITDSGFSYILNRIAVGRTEREIALDLEFFMRKQGSDGVSFDFISVSGKNSSLPHGVPTDKRIESGDFLTLDFGAVVDGYHSDMTRTVAIGNITDEQREVYNIVLSAQKAALAGISVGKKCCDIDKIARDIIAESGYGKAFGHALGHSVGLEIHETPNFSPKCEKVLQIGNVMTVEPGIYIENKFGVRIEDMITVTENGIENLTKSPKDLIIL